MAKRSKHKKVKKRVEFGIDDFKYLDERILPQLVLGIEIHRRSLGEEIPVYEFAEGRTWLKIGHQTAGVACQQHYLYGMILTPKSELITAGMKLLSEKWLDSNAGMFKTSLDEVVEYRADLKRIFDVDCNASFHDFEEAYYPIDLSPENLSKLTTDSLPRDLDDLIIWRDGFQRACGMIGRYGLWILGENSD